MYSKQLYANMRTALLSSAHVYFANPISVGVGPVAIAQQDIPPVDPDQHPNLVSLISAAGKSNDDADKYVLRDLSGNNNYFNVKDIVFSSIDGAGYGGYILSPAEFVIDPLYARINAQNSNIIDITAFNSYQEYANIPITTEGQIVRIKVTGITAGASITIGRGSPLTIIADGEYEYEVQYEDVPGDMSESDGYIHISSYGTPPTGIVSVEFLPEYPDCIVIPRGARLECPNLKLDTDFTIIAQIKNVDEYSTSNVDKNFITISGQSNLVSVKYGYSDAIVQRVTVGTHANMFGLPFRTNRYVITPDLFNTEIVTGRATLASGLKNMCIVGGGDLRIEIGKIAIYNKTLSSDEIESEIIKYSI